MADREKIRAGLWMFSPFLLAGLRDPVGSWLGIPTASTQEELLKLLFSPNTQQLWMTAILYRITILLLISMAVAIALENVLADFGWRYALLLIGPLTAALLIFLPLEEVEIIFTFGVLDLFRCYVVQKIKAWKGQAI